MAPPADQSTVAARGGGCPSAHAASIVARRGLGLLALALVLVAALATSAQAASVGLGSAGGFSVLGATTVTNTGPSRLTGDLGVSPGTAITGFGPGTVNGTTHTNDGLAMQAQNDLTTAYVDAAGRSSTATVTTDLAGNTLSPGVYTSATALGLSGDLTLDAQGDPDAVFVFQAGSSLTTGAGSRVLLVGGAQACNVFWQVGSSATIGTTSAFVGTILALTSISLTTGATVDGRALARNGAVTLDTNVVTRSACAPTAGTITTTPPGGTGATGGGTATTTDGVGSTTADGGGSTTTGGADRPGASGVTPARPTAVTTGRASLADCDHARLAGWVRAGAGAARYHFQFGRTRRYGRRTRSAHLAASPDAVHAHALIRGLRRGTYYHYRLVSVSSAGRRTLGADRRFRACERGAGPSRSPTRPPRSSPGFTG